MFAVVEIAAQQFTVRPSDTLTVPLLDAEVGSSVEFGNILLGGEESNVSIGNPYLSGSVKATVLAHGKGDKILVFKKKRRKGYRKLNGHRQHYTQIQITILSSDKGVIEWHTKKGPDLPRTAVTQIPNDVALSASVVKSFQREIFSCANVEHVFIRVTM